MQTEHTFLWIWICSVNVCGTVHSNTELDWWWWVCLGLSECVCIPWSLRQGIIEIDYCGSWSHRLVCVSQGWLRCALLRDVCMSEAVTWRKVAGGERKEQGEKKLITVCLLWIRPEQEMKRPPHTRSSTMAPAGLKTLGAKPKTLTVLWGGDKHEIKDAFPDNPDASDLALL